MKIWSGAHVDLGIDQHQALAGFEAHFAEQIEPAAALRAPAEHHALAVIALLHAGIQVAVPVEGQEKLLQQLLRRFARQHAAFKIPLQERHGELIEPPDGVVIVALQPQPVMHNAEGL